MAFHGRTYFTTIALVVAMAGGCRNLSPDSASDPLRPAKGFQGNVPSGTSHDGSTQSIEPGASGVVLAAAVEDSYGWTKEEEDSGFQLSDLAPTNVFDQMKNLAGYGPDERVARGFNEEGKLLYSQKHYKQAASCFKSAAARWPNSPLAEDALFMAAESYFFADDYPEANKYYGKLLEKYDYTQYLDTVSSRLFEIGRYWEQIDLADPSWPITPNFLDGRRPLFDTMGNAIKAYDMIRLYDPTGPLADHSVMATANAHFFKKHYEEAAYHYELLRKEYSQSEHQLPAHVLGMRSKMAMYQGSMYDGQPLMEAGKIADQALLRFRDELGDHRKLVLETRNRVTEELAMREWSMGQYYDKKKYYGAARLYYQSILDEYPRTTIASKAQARLEEIRDQPDQPTNYFKWLDKAFSGEDELQSHSIRKFAPLTWLNDSHGPQRLSEEFRDERTRQ